MKTKRVYSWVLLFLCLLLCLSSAFSAESIELDRDVSLTLHSHYEEINVPNMPFSLYRVADISADGKYSLCGDFTRYSNQVKLSALNNGHIAALGETLTGLAQRDELSPLCKGKTNGNGMLAFPKEGVSMKPGLYLAVGELTKLNGYCYITEPLLIMLPHPVEEEALDYDVIASPKLDRWAEGEGVTRCKVLKVWADTGHMASRPKEISVQLLKDGTAIDTVKLNAGNKWSYTWEELSEGSQYRVTETAVTNYTTLIQPEGITYVITNTHKDGSETPDSPDPLLPSTGTSWYLVPFLLSGGLLFIVVGLFIKRRQAEA